MTLPLPELAAELEHEHSTLERELAEIDMLMRQAGSEAERHEERRAQAEERLLALDKDPLSDAAMLIEARTQLISQTRRQTMMQGQVEVLQGKHRALQRFQKRLDQIVLALDEARSNGRGQATGGGGAPGRGPGSGTATSRDVMAAQEQMRREIARQMHDGPAQSIANIALQAQVVQQLLARDPAQAEAELRELVGMVQNALDATKNFIFDVRPMVLDDLGLVPTLRRTAAERSRRSGQSVLFESVGADSRLLSELESTLFRIVDDAVQGFLDGPSDDVLVRLDWHDGGLKATVRGQPRAKRDAPAEVARAAVAAARRDKQIPQALASMIHDQEDAAARGLTAKVLADLHHRADPVGIELFLSDDGWLLEATVSGVRS